jgi:hypothetical protein
MSLAQLAFESGGNIAHLGESAFSDCSSLRSISVPSSLETIPDCYSIGCLNLASLTFEPDSQMLFFGDHAFANSPSLHSIWIPARLDQVFGFSFALFAIRSLLLIQEIPFTKLLAVFWLIVVPIA